MTNTATTADMSVGPVSIGTEKTLTIDLNGHILTAAENQRAFNVWNGSTLEIKGTGIIQGNGTVSGAGGAINMQGDSSKLVISGGTIQGFTASTHGGGVYMNGGTFEMTGGKIYNCRSSGTNLSGGGVFMEDGTFDMSGGSNENCTADDGAGVKVYPDSGKTCKFTMSGSAEIKNCSKDGVSIGSKGTAEFILNGGTIQGNAGRGVWTSQSDSGTTSVTLNGGTVQYESSDSENIYIGSGVTLTANNTIVSGRVVNFGTLTGDGNAQFTGTVEKAGYGNIDCGKFTRIEDRSFGGTMGPSVQCDDLVYLIGYSWPTAKIPTEPGSNISLKFLSYVSEPAMENTLTIPAEVTVTVDLAGKPVSNNGDFKIINNGNLTLVDSGAGTLSIPIENNGTMNANGGTVTSEVTNNGTINNGQFTGAVTNNGKIVDGKYAGEVTNNGTIDNGKFTGTVTNEETGTISSGDFTEGKLINNGGKVPSKPEPEKPAPDGDKKDEGEEKPKPDDTKKDDDKPGTEEPVTPVTKLYALTVKNAEVTIEDAAKTVEATKNEDGNLTAKVPEGAKVTVKYTAPTDAIVFDLWSITSDATLDVNVKENPLTFTMPDKAVTIEAMTRDATIESDGPGVLGTAAMIGVGVAGTAVLGYQGYMIGTELYLNSVLPEGAAIPQNYGELAKLVWNDAGRPEPIALLAADATDEQKALTWAVENQLISADKAADASVTRWEVIRAWNQAQERKQA